MNCEDLLACTVCLCTHLLSGWFLPAELHQVCPESGP